MENFIFYAMKEKIGWLVSIWLPHQMSNIMFQKANESSQAFVSWECFLIPPVMEFFNQIVLNNLEPEIYSEFCQGIFWHI